jgi:hypothetical protein
MRQVASGASPIYDRQDEKVTAAPTKGASPLSRGRWIRSMAKIDETRPSEHLR